MLRQGAWLLAAVVAVAVGGAPADAAAPGTPRCFGAASRDTLQPCHNPRLRRMVRPTPDEAAITPNLGCVRAQLSEILDECAYGVPADEAVETVAIFGDSHAAHWRAAMDVVAARKRWRVLEVGRPHCPFTFAISASGEPWTSQCVQWNREAIAWLGDHPEVRILFVTANAQAPLIIPAGQTDYETRLNGYLDAWSALPASVKRIMAIRDNPTDRTATHDCIRRALRRHKAAGWACRTPRRLVLPDDPAVEAAHRLRPRGGRVIDLTRFFCGRRKCLPVVGGALVHKDVDHLSQPFARTLGPYLLRAVDRFPFTRTA